jgi:hypothetical protein
MADLGVGDLSWADCLSGVAHLMGEAFDWSGSVADALCHLSVAVARSLCGHGDTRTCCHDCLSETPLQPSQIGASVYCTSEAAKP